MEKLFPVCEMKETKSFELYGNDRKSSSCLFVCFLLFFFFFFFFFFGTEFSMKFILFIVLVM